MMRRPSLFLLLFLLAGFSQAHAQVPVATDPRVAVVARLRPGSTVRIATPSADLVLGTFTGLRAETLAVRALGTERLVPTNSIEELWVRGRATKGAALYTGIVGAVLFGAAGYALYGLCLGDGCSPPGESRLVTTLGSAALGGAVFALIGGAIGAAIPKWHRRYP